MSKKIAVFLYKSTLSLIPIFGILWLLDVPEKLGLSVLDGSYLLTMVGLATAAGLIGSPFREKAGINDLLLAIIALGCWFWGAYNFSDWLLDVMNRGPQKWIPGAVGMLLLLEALRRKCGMSITALVALIGAYAFLGHNLPGAFEAAYTDPARLILYFFADTNGVPGLVLNVVTSIVFGFVILGVVMSEVGSSKFFTDFAMAAMGHRRGGPAKVAVVASSLFGAISGSTIGNVMTTGVITIPMMKRSGFPKHIAGAIEAVASNGGQLAPPIMGTTAFLIAEFLQIPYIEVVAAATIPAAIYYIVLFAQVDLIAVRYNLHGISRDQLPKMSTTIRKGWLYIVPFVLLIYLMFFLGYNLGKTAIFCTLLTAVLGLFMQRRYPNFSIIKSLIEKSGESLVTLTLLCAAVGIVIGSLNITGLGFLLTNTLANIGADSGLIVMLVMTAVIALFLGTGMPTAAVYIVLSVILAPALVEMGVPEISAHLFIFYFGLLSMLTPPVAIASYAAGGLAGASLWETGNAGLKLAASAFILPFLFCLNPALVGQGSWLAILLAFITVSFGGYLLAKGLVGDKNGGVKLSIFYFIAALLVSTSTLWVGPESILSLAPAIIAFLMVRGIGRLYNTHQSVKI